MRTIHSPNKMNLNQDPYEMITNNNWMVVSRMMVKTTEKATRTDLFNMIRCEGRKFVTHTIVTSNIAEPMSLAVCSERTRAP